MARSVWSIPEPFPGFSLPKVIHIPAEQGHIAPGFTETVRLIAREATTPRLGTQAMLRRLTELLFIQVIRIWVEQQAGAETGWLAALHDQSISTALGLIHQSPERGWKVVQAQESSCLSSSACSHNREILGNSVCAPPGNVMIST